MGEKDKAERVSDYDYIISTIDDAFFSGMSFDQFWECIINADGTKEGLNAAVSAQIKLNEIAFGDKFIKIPNIQYFP